ncbi:serine/threonine protein kinase [Plasmodium falciparum IGH-CR14]|uniref:non-specific serine/threonine protein kinase n=1 Tax=Plasmodium falciparum IGH-CR14 TaxID=580059 RepID=A0A0L1IBZ9_PLAFA|nr:serine/threonine protein kinase [Plasmodium falciparum IGH-CR14]
MKFRKSKNEKKNEQQDDLLKNKEDDLLKNKEGDLLKNKGDLLKNKGDLLKNEEGDLLKNEEGDLLKNKGDLIKNKEGDLLKSKEGDLIKNKEGDLIKNKEGDLLKSKEGDLIKNKEGDLLKSKEGDLIKNKEGDLIKNKEDVLLNKGYNILQNKNDDLLQNEYYNLLQNEQDDNQLKGNTLITTKKEDKGCMKKTHENKAECEKNEDKNCMKKTHENKAECEKNEDKNCMKKTHGNKAEDEKNEDILLMSPTKGNNLWTRLKKGFSRGMCMNFLLNDNNEKKLSTLYVTNMLKNQLNSYYGSKNSNDKKLEKSDNEGGEEKYDNSNKEQNMIYNWKIGKECFMKKLDSVHNFEMNGVNYYDFNLISIPTIGYSKSSKRLQLMYKTYVIYGENENDKNNLKKKKLFLKKVPANLWIEQYKLMKEYDGEYVYSGENYVMEFLVLSFLDTYHPNICPKLYKILYEPPNKEYIKDENKKFQNIDDFVKYMEDIIEHNKRNNANNNVDNNNNIHNHKNNINYCITNSDNKHDNNNNDNNSDNNCGYVVMVSEYYGEDIFDFIIKRRKNIFLKIRRKDKINILHACLKLLARLHDAGLCHLDLTPDNILISKSMDLRLCDFAKSTPMYSNKLRHLKESEDSYKFESYETHVAKSAYTPPECWEIYWRYYELKIKEPLEYLKLITNQEERKQFYFDVACADKFMLGVLFIWIWTSGNLWVCSDPLQDDYFHCLMKSDMNFNNFPCSQNWPHGLKHIIKQLLHMKYRKDLNLNILGIHPWWYKKK